MVGSVRFAPRGAFSQVFARWERRAKESAHQMQEFRSVFPMNHIHGMGSLTLRDVDELGWLWIPPTARASMALFAIVFPTLFIVCALVLTEPTKYVCAAVISCSIALGPIGMWRLIIRMPWNAQHAMFKTLVRSIHDGGIDLTVGQEQNRLTWIQFRGFWFTRRAILLATHADAAPASEHEQLVVIGCSQFRDAGEWSRACAVIASNVVELPHPPPRLFNPDDSVPTQMECCCLMELPSAIILGPVLWALAAVVWLYGRDFVPNAVEAHLLHVGGGALGMTTGIVAYLRAYSAKRITAMCLICIGFYAAGELCVQLIGLLFLDDSSRVFGAIGFGTCLSLLSSLVSRLGSKRGLTRWSRTPTARTPRPSPTASRTATVPAGNCLACKPSPASATRFPTTGADG